MHKLTYAQKTALFSICTLRVWAHSVFGLVFYRPLRTHREAQILLWFSTTLHCCAFSHDTFDTLYTTYFLSLAQVPHTYTYTHFSAVQILKCCCWVNFELMQGKSERERGSEMQKMTKRKKTKTKLVNIGGFVLCLLLMLLSVLFEWVCVFSLLKSDNVFWL